MQRGGQDHGRRDTQHGRGNGGTTDAAPTAIRAIRSPTALANDREHREARREVMLRISIRRPTGSAVRKLIAATPIGSVTHD